MKRPFRRGDPQRQSYWQEVMRRWKESGQSVRGFCRAEGLRESAFFFWRRRLEHRSGATGRMSKPRHKASRLAPATQSSDGLSSLRHGTPSFLPVHVTVPASERANGAESHRGVEIVLAQGTIRVPQGFDRQTLAEVLAVLEMRSC
jgi:transposase-like protein